MSTHKISSSEPSRDGERDAGETGIVIGDFSTITSFLFSLIKAPRVRGKRKEKKWNEEDIEPSDYWTVKQVESHYDEQHEKE